MTTKIKIKKINENAKIPTYGSEFAAGADLYVCMENPVTIEPHTTVMLHTGIAMEIPAGYAGLIYPRSGMASKRHLAPANKVGVVDPDYRGEFMVAMHNHSDEPQTVEPGERIAQLVITPFITAAFEESDELSETVRGDGGFASSGYR